MDVRKLILVRWGVCSHNELFEYFPKTIKKISSFELGDDVVCQIEREGILLAPT